MIDLDAAHESETGVTAGASVGGPPEYIDPRLLLGSYRSDLYFPRYRAIASGPWTMRAVPMLTARGYWGDVYPIAGALILSGPGEAGAQSWMSMMPSEIESQEIGLRQSHGHTAIFGLGMGWLAANVALRREVERVSVVERDANVIALIRACEIFEQLPRAARHKISVHHADALSWVPDAPVDTLQADIWRRLVEPGKLAAVQRMQANVGAGSVYFWGQELEIWRHACRRAGAIPQDLDLAALKRIVTEDLRLPLILAESDDYAKQIRRAASCWTPGKDDWWREA